MRVLIAGYYGFQNLGDELILTKIIRDITSLEGDGEIAVWTGDAAYTRRVHGVKTVDRFSPDETRDAVSWADVVIVGGGGLLNEYYPVNAGDLFRDYGRHLPAYATVPLLAKIMQKPIFYWGHGVGPFFTPEGREFARWFYGLADEITVRDPYSHALLRDIFGGEIARLHLDIDPVMDLDLRGLVKPGDISRPADRPLLGIQLREWFGIRAFLGVLAEVLTRVWDERREMRFVPVPFNLSSDGEVLEKLFDRLPGDAVWDRAASFEEAGEVLARLNGLDMFLGMRFHAVMCAAILRRPIFCLSYDTKTDEFCKWARIPFVEVGGVSADDIYRALNDFLDCPRAGELPGDITYKTRDIFKEFLEKEVKCQERRGKENAEPSTDDTYAERYIRGMRAEIGELQAAVYRLVDEKRRVQRENEKLKNQIDVFRARLEEVYSTRFWRLAEWYYKKTESSFLFRGVHRLVSATRRALRGTRPGPEGRSLADGAASTRQIARDVRDFVEQRHGSPFYIVYAGVKFTDTEGQRSVRLAQAFAKRGFPVLFVYHNWGAADRNQYGVAEDGIFVLSKDAFLENYDSILAIQGEREGERVFLVEMPDLKVIKPLVEANARNVTTVYDILDNWEGFAQKGLAPWYDEDVEYFILRNVKLRFAVNDTLTRKFEQFKIYVISNGYAPDKLVDGPKVEMERGEVTIGYFGYLAKGRLDWDLVLETARENSTYLFYLIGYAMPEDVSLPPNVRYVGHLHPRELSSHVKMWDVCMVPFEDNDLTRGLDPIKIYEYLFFRKPVVVTGGMGHIHAFPYLFFAENNVDSFKKAILKAKEAEIDEAVIKAFLIGKSWAERAGEMVRIIGGEGD